MDKELQEVVDAYQIRKALNRYSRGIDRIDENLIRSAYHEDATDHHGIFNGSPADFATFAVKGLKRELCTSHLQGQCDIEFAGDTAFAETYFLASHLRQKMKSQGEGPHLATMSGRYVDRFEKISGEWRIAERTVVADWLHVQKLNEGPLDVNTFVRPKQSIEDPSYVGRRA